MKRLAQSFSIVVVLLVATTILAQTPPASPLHPEVAVNLLAWFKGSAVLVMVVVGMIWKYAPFAKSWSNDLIPWVNMILYIVATLAGVTPAMAATGGGQAHNVVTTIALGFLHSAFAKVLWDGWLKPQIDKKIR